MANVMTASRILCGVLLLFFPAFSLWFYGLYLLGGATDVLDGLIARKTGTVSEWGAKLDTIADILFFGASWVKLLPTMLLSTWVWGWAAVIALIKLINIASGFVCMGRFVTEHTVMNKVAGALIFVWPLTWLFAEPRYSAAAVCCAATFAAIQEGHYIRTGQEIV